MGAVILLVYCKIIEKGLLRGGPWPHGLAGVRLLLSHLVYVRLRPGAMVPADLLLLGLHARVPVGVRSQFVVVGKVVQSHTRAVRARSVLDVELSLYFSGLLGLSSKLPLHRSLLVRTHYLDGTLSVADVQAVVELVRRGFLKLRAREPSTVRAKALGSPVRLQPVLDLYRTGPVHH